MPAPRYIGMLFLEGLAKGQIPVTKAIRLIRQAGRGYNAQQMHDDYRKFSGRMKYQTQIENLSVNQYVSRSWLSEVELEQPTKYRVHGTMTLYDAETDTYLQQRASFFTDDFNKIGDYQQGFFDHYSGTYQEQDLEITEFKIFSIEHDPNRPY